MPVELGRGRLVSLGRWCLKSGAPREARPCVRFCWRRNAQAQRAYISLLLHILWSMTQYWTPTRVSIPKVSFFQIETSVPWYLTGEATSAHHFANLNARSQLAVMP